MSRGIRGPYTLWYRSATADPPVILAQVAARCSWASLLAA